MDRHLNYMLTLLRESGSVHDQLIKTTKNKHVKVNRTKMNNLILKRWLYRNYSYPYPSPSESRTLAQQCSLTYKQVDLILILDSNLVYKR